MNEGEKRAAQNAFDNYMNNLKDQWDAAQLVFATRIHKLNQEFKDLDLQVMQLKNNIKNYKKTFTQCESYARKAIDEMDEARVALYKLLSNYPTEALEKVEKICEILEKGY